MGKRSVCRIWEIPRHTYFRNEKVWVFQFHRLFLLGAPSFLNIRLGNPASRGAFFVHHAFRREVKVPVVPWGVFVPVRPAGQFFRPFGGEVRRFRRAHGKRDGEAPARHFNAAQFLRLRRGNRASRAFHFVEIHKRGSLSSTRGFVHHEPARPHRAENSHFLVHLVFSALRRDVADEHGRASYGFRRSLRRPEQRGRGVGIGIGTASHRVCFFRPRSSFQIVLFLPLGDLFRDSFFPRQLPRLSPRSPALRVQRRALRRVLPGVGVVHHA
mmetsp:Transcript_10039/g.37230  ORF Transcript_10039/g.37230 Transcript_10039/m.37230 type:complete len:270 (-) Transcript_10039:1609-2418(-)